MKRLAAVAVLAIVAGVIAFAVLARSRDEVGSAGRVEPDPVTGEPALAWAPARPKAARAEESPPLPAPPRGASITGTVTRDGKPAAARVEIRPLGDALLTTRSLLHPIYATGPALASTESDAEGRFRLGGLAIGRYQVVARAEDGATAWQRAFCEVRSPHAKVSLALVGGTESIDAMARYGDGRPFRGLVSIGLGGLQWLPEVETDAEGRFRFRGIPAGTWGVAFVLPDRQRSSFTVEVPLAPGRVFVVDEGLAELTATVVELDTERPVVGAEAFVNAGDPPTGRRLIARHVTDEQGEIRFQSVGKDPSFWIEKDGYETLRTTAAAKEPIRLRLSRQGTLRGRVLKAGAAVPVPGVPVHGWDWGTFAMKSPLAVSDAEGRFSARAGPGKGMLYALGNGWVSPALADLRDSSVNRTLVEVGPGSETVVDLEVVPAGRVEGRLLDAAGRPLAGVLVRLEDAADGAPLRQALLPAEACSATTSADGAFAIDDVVPSLPWRIAAQPEGGLPARSEVVSTRSGETIRVDLRVPAACALVVRVREKGSGRAVGGANVVAGARRHWVHGTTGPDGTVRLEPLLPEPLSLTVDHPDYVSPFGPSTGKSQTLPAPAPDPSTYDVELERGAFVAGVVVEADGATPRAMGAIGVFPVGERRGYGLGLTGLTGLRKGRFRLGPVPAGTYDLILVEEGASWATTKDLDRWTVETGREDLVLRVDPARAEKEDDQVVVRVVTADGDRVDGFLRVFTRERVLERMAILREGTCVCREVPAGTTAWIELRGGRAGETPLPGSVHGPVRLAKGVTEIRLPKPQWIQGRVVGEDGSPIAGLLLRAAPAPPVGAPGPDDAFAMASVRTDERGNFRVAGGDSSTVLLVEVPAAYALTPDPTVAAPGATDVLITLAKGQDVDLTVVDPEGRPLPGATIEAAVPGLAGRARRGKTDARGSLRLTGLARDAAYRLTVAAPPERTDLADVVNGAWRAVSGRIELPGGETVRGVVRSGTGVVSGAVVWWTEDETAWRQIPSGPDGAFAFTARSGAKVTLRAARGGSVRPDTAGPPLQVAAGAVNVVARVPE